MKDLEISEDGAVLRLTLNAPERLNAVDTPLIEAMSDAITSHRDVRVAVIRGAGGAFCSGAKLSEDGPNAGILDAAFRLMTAVTTAPFPVIAAVDGPAAGIGCSLALAADLTVASERSYFLQAFIRIGLMPDGGATELLSSSIGRAQALWLAMSGERMPARTALERGLIGACVPDDQFEESVEDLVQRCATGPTMALARTKMAINAASIPHFTRTLELERAGQTSLLSSEDYREGVTAFKAKRPALFHGR